jgi:sulfofructose kinase
LTDSDEEAPLWRERGGPRDWDVLGVGQNALDRVLLLAHHPQPGEKLQPLASADLPGGQVATAVLTCATLGLRCRYVGSIGDDDAGRAALAPLRAAAVDLSGVVCVPGSASQTAVILVDRDSGERTILWHRPAALSLAPGVPDAVDIARARLLLLDAGDPEAAAWAAGVARGAGVPVVLDADRYLPELEPLLSQVDFPLVSRGFAESMQGPSEVRRTLRELHRRGARLAAVTLGDAGVAAWFQDREIDVPAVTLGASDTTGAGDVFHGAFAWALLEGWGAQKVLRAACAAAALSCLAAGAQGGLPERSDVERLLAGAAN